MDGVIRLSHKSLEATYSYLLAFISAGVSRFPNGGLFSTGVAYNMIMGTTPEDFKNIFKFF